MTLSSFLPSVGRLCRRALLTGILWMQTLLRFASLQCLSILAARSFHNYAGTDEDRPVRNFVYRFLAVVVKPFQGLLAYITLYHLSTEHAYLVPLVNVIPLVHLHSMILHTRISGEIRIGLLILFLAACQMLSIQGNPITMCYVHYAFWVTNLVCAQRGINLLHYPMQWSTHLNKVIFGKLAFVSFVKHIVGALYTMTALITLSYFQTSDLTLLVSKTLLLENLSALCQGCHQTKSHFVLYLIPFLAAMYIPVTVPLHVYMILVNIVGFYFYVLSPVSKDDMLDVTVTIYPELATYMSLLVPGYKYGEREKSDQSGDVSKPRNVLELKDFKRFDCAEESDGDDPAEDPGDALIQSSQPTMMVDVVKRTSGGLPSLTVTYPHGVHSDEGMPTETIDEFIEYNTDSDIDSTTDLED